MTDESTGTGPGPHGNGERSLFPATQAALDRWACDTSKRDWLTDARAELEAVATPRQQFLDDVCAVVKDHWSGLPEDRPDVHVWARLDAVLFDDEGYERPHPDFTATPDFDAWRR